MIEIREHVDREYLDEDGHKRRDVSFMTPFGPVCGPTFRDGVVVDPGRPVIIVDDPTLKQIRVATRLGDGWPWAGARSWCDGDVLRIQLASGASFTYKLHEARFPTGPESVGRKWWIAVWAD